MEDHARQRKLLPERNLPGLAVLKIRAGPRQSTVIHPNPGLDCGCIAGVLFRLKALEYGTEFSVNTSRASAPRSEDP